MSNEDDTIWIVFNGEIYNYLELKKELESKGHKFKSKTDTEVIIHAYEEWGQKCFANFNGDWAIGILDIPKKKVILSRDRFSIKPLYYGIFNKTFYFASEIKQILPFIDRKEINYNVMFNFLRQGLMDFNQETFFKGIYKIKPMHNMVIDLADGKMNEIEYWNYHSERVPKDEKEIIQKFRDLFIDSIRIRLRSDVPVGGLLSGGLDSSSIAVVANEMTKGSFNCFSVVFRDVKYSEEKFLDILKNEKGLKIEKLFLEPKLAWNGLKRVISYHDEPFFGFAVVARHQMLRLIKEKTNVTILLNGQGGDEILCGYKKFFFFYLKEELRKHHYLNVLENTFLSILLRTVLWQFSFSEAKRYLPFFQKNNDPIGKILKIKGELEPVWELKTLKERQILDIDKYSIPVLAHFEDRISTTYSLETRLPFLDYRLVNFILNLPDSFKIKNGFLKYILRKSIRELPRKIAWRRDKQGFLTPEEKWLKNDFKNEIINLFKESRLDKMGILDKEKLLEVYKSFLRGDKKIWYGDITRIIIAELWLREIFK